MSVLVNRTAFQGEMLPSQGSDGRFSLTVVIKATYVIDAQERLVPASVQDPVNVSDEYLGTPGESSIRQASDMAIFKESTDIALIGSAYASGETPVTQMSVELAVGRVRKRVLVFGDRVWDHRFGVLSKSEPAYFTTMPLIYERAYGGKDQGKWEERNPVGVGFHLEKPGTGSPLPNLEDPANLISSWSDRPIPQGFGFIPGDWQPRKSFLGTYDDRWKEDQFPLPPQDFDQRYFLAAHPDLRCTPHLNGDETVEVLGASPDGLMRFSLPGNGMGLSVEFRTGSPKRRLGVLDTVTIFPDERKVHLVWRHLIQCPRRILDVETVTAFSLRLSTIRRLASAIS